MYACRSLYNMYVKELQFFIKVYLYNNNNAKFYWGVCSAVIFSKTRLTHTPLSMEVEDEF